MSGELFAAQSPLQKFVPKQIHRLEIKNADYNPRTITPEKREKLKQSLGEFGLVNAFVWNQRTGNLVGGHQRLSVLDDLSDTGQDYFITVDAIDVDEVTEKKINVALNARQAQGDFDEDLLNALLKDLEGTAGMDLDALLNEAQSRADVKLTKLNIPKPPKMAWVLVGIPVLEFGKINAHVEAIAAVEGTLVESTFNGEAK